MKKILTKQSFKTAGRMKKILTKDRFKTASREVYKQHRAFVFYVNICLLLFLFIQYDPFNLIRTGYASSPRLAQFSPENLEKIEIINKEYDKKKVLLLKDGVLPKSLWHEEIDTYEFNASTNTKEKKIKKTHFFDRFFSYNKKQMKWKFLNVSNNTDTHEVDASYDGSLADVQRVYELFEGLNSARRFYPLKENEEEYGMQTNSKGEYENIIIKLHFNKKQQDAKSKDKADKGNESAIAPKKKGDDTKDQFIQTIYVGNSDAANNESYLRFNDEKKVYRIKRDFRNLLGDREVDYFRDRNVLPHSLVLAYKAKKNLIKSVYFKKEFTKRNPAKQNSESFYEFTNLQWNLKEPILEGTVKQDEFQKQLDLLFSMRIAEFSDKSALKDLQDAYGISKFAIEISYDPLELGKNKEFISDKDSEKKDLDKIKVPLQKTTKSFKLKVLGMNANREYVVQLPDSTIATIAETYTIESTIQSFFSPKESLMNISKVPKPSVIPTK